MVSLLFSVFVALGGAPEPSIPLFKGKDLTGWVNVNCAPGTFFVRDNEIVTTGEPTGFLRTDKHYENFILEFEWMHTRPKGMANSGLFVWGDPIPAIGSPYTRGIEVQVLCNFEVDWATSHGDVFSIWGARCKPDRPHPKGYERCLPSEKRCKGPGEWNHYKVIANNGSIKLHVNGKEVSGVSDCSPRKGYLALESEGSQCRFRNIKIVELPSSNPTPEFIADVAKGHRSLFDGMTLTGWNAGEKSWIAAGGQLKAKGTQPLQSAQSYDIQEFLFDWKLPPKSSDSCLLQFMDGKNDLELQVNHRGDYKIQPLHVRTTPLASGRIPNVNPGQWYRSQIRIKNKQASIFFNNQHLIDIEIKQPFGKAQVNIPAVKGLELMNLYVLENSK